jgi:PAS domain S-box-containing protein
VTNVNKTSRHKKNAEGTSQAEQRLDLCLSAGNLAWWEMDVSTGKVVFNENKVRMLGYRPEDFKDADYHSFMDLIHPDDYDQVMKAMSDHIEGKKSLYEIEYRIKTKNGGYKWFHDRGSIVRRDEQQRPLAVKGVVFDITHRKQIENKLRELHKQLQKKVDQQTKELVKTNLNLQREIKDRKRFEEKALETKDHLENVINSASEIIMSFTVYNRVLTWNAMAESVTGYKLKDVMNRSISTLEIFEQPAEISRYIQRVCEKKHRKHKDFTITTKAHEKRILRLYGTPLLSHNKECLGALLMGKDITKEIEMHGKLVNGTGYLIASDTHNTALSLFLDLVSSGHKGLVITRLHPQVHKEIAQNLGVTIALFGLDEISGFPTILDGDKLLSICLEFVQKHEENVILIDGIHYLLTLFPFDHVASTLFRLNDAMATHGGLLLVRIDFATMTTIQQAIIQNELQTLPSQRIENIILSDELYDLLRYIYEQNNLNALVSLKKIMHTINIAYGTATTRLRLLEEHELILTKKRGKMRTVYITDKGKNLLHNRQTV